MKVPPAWKVKRELWRVKEKLQDLVLPKFTDRLKQMRHDRNLAAFLRETPGSRPLTGRVSVFVLFQPNGIAGSTFLTLDHLSAEGWSVIVISNTSLTDVDRERLADKAAHVIERPNTGYDFGAYREGWRWLTRLGHRVDRLIIMNDSSWFPLRREDASLRRMEALDVDLTGHIYKSEKTEDRGRDHVESHLLMLGPRAVSHPAIAQYWAKYKMSDSKALTILRGEKGIAQAALNAGLSVKGLLGRERIVELLSALSTSELLVVLRSLALHSQSGRHQRELWTEAGDDFPEWRDEFLQWTARELSNSRQHLISATFIDPAMSLGGMGFLKKSNERRFQLARLAVLRGIEEGRIAPLDPVVDAEVRATVAAWKPLSDWRANPNERQVVEL